MINPITKTLAIGALATIAASAIAWFGYLSPSARYENQLDDIFNEGEIAGLRHHEIPADFARDVAIASEVATQKERKGRGNDGRKVRTFLVDDIKCIRDNGGTPELADKIRDFEYYGRNSGRVCRAAKAGVTVDDIDKYKRFESSFRFFDTNDIIDFKKAGITPDFIDFVLRQDLKEKSVRSILALNKTDRDYIENMIVRGFRDPFCISTLGQHEVPFNDALDMKRFYTEEEIKYFVKNEVSPEYSVKVAELLGGIEGKSEYQMFGIVEEIIDLSNSSDTSLELLSALLPEDHAKPRRVRQFLEEVDVAITDHGLDKDYVNAMYGLSSEFSAWEVMALKAVGATEGDVKCLINAGYEPSIDDIPEIIADDLVDYAVKVSEASDGNVWGGYMDDLHGSGVPLEYIGTLAKAANVSGDEMSGIHRTGASAEEVIAIMEELPIFDRDFSRVWNAGVRPENISQIKQDPHVKKYLDMAERNEFVDTGQRFNANAKLHLASAVINTAYDQGLIE